MDSLDIIPDDILAEILSFSNYSDLASAETICKRFLILIKGRDMWLNLCYSRSGLKRREVLRKKNIRESKDVDEFTKEIVGATSKQCYRNWFQVPINCNRAPAEEQELEIRDNDNGLISLRYTGNNWGEERCVRFEVPFPSLTSRFPFASISRRNKKSNSPQLNMSMTSYFEVTIKSSGRMRPNELIGRRRTREWKSCVAIGICKESFPPLGCLPGWTTNAYGFHGDDGKLFHGSGVGNPYHLHNLDDDEEDVSIRNTEFKAGDIIGMGIEYPYLMQIGQVDFNLTIFYTLNGINLGKAFERVPFEKWYGCVGFDSYDTVEINFGEQPFLYDIVAHEKERFTNTNHTKPFHEILNATYKSYYGLYDPEYDNNEEYLDEEFVDEDEDFDHEDDFDEDDEEDEDEDEEHENIVDMFHFAAPPVLEGDYFASPVLEGDLEIEIQGEHFVAVIGEEEEEEEGGENDYDYDHVYLDSNDEGLDDYQSEGKAGEDDELLPAFVSAKKVLERKEEKE